MIKIVFHLKSKIIAWSFHCEDIDRIYHHLKKHHIECYLSCNLQILQNMVLEEEPPHRVFKGSSGSSPKNFYVIFDRKHP